MTFENVLKATLALAFLLLSPCTFADQKVTVFAAASLTNAIGEIAAQYEKDKSVSVSSAFASSAVLAKQIENGAPADIFISADLKWMNALQDKKKIDAESRRNLLGNRLVLIAPKGKGFKVHTEKSFDFAKALDGRLCTGDLESVPAGIYAKQSLLALTWWDSIKSRMVGTQDVRSALAFVERGECAAGIVYETDAKISTRTEIIATFPEETHDAIVYPVALVTGSHAEGRDFLDYLGTPKAQAIFVKYGFSLIKR